MDPKTRQSIYEEWIDRVFGVEFKKKDIFVQRKQSAAPEDPFHETVRSDLTKIIDILFSDAPVDGTLAVPEGSVVPENLMRLRAVQEISAAEAVSHIFVLKDIVRERFGREKAYDDLSRRLDFLVLHTFNAYAKCRDNLYRLRIREMAEYGAEETFSCRTSASSRTVAPAQIVSGSSLATGGEP